MEALRLLSQGFADILSWYNLAFIFIGAMLGTIIGALPGLGPSAGIALILPITLGVPVESALSLLSGIYLGATYGGRITSILVNVPGDATSVCTTFDDYPLMQQGKGALAMGVSAYTSFVGGCIGLGTLVFGAPIVTSIAVTFGPPEYFMLMLLGLSTISLLAEKGIFKAAFMTFFGFVIGMIGTDFVSGYTRFAFTPDLLEGIDFVTIIVGIYGIGEVLLTMENAITMDIGKPSFKIREFIPPKDVLKKMTLPAIRGGVIGTLTGILPGAGGTMATFLAYGLEKKVSKNPEKFGKGALEGVAAPESADNACVGGAMLTALTLGIPGSGTTAVMLGALIMFGLRPGPLLMTKSGNIIWAVIAGLLISNVLLVISNIVLIPLFVNIVRSVQKYLSPIIVVLCMIGAFSLNFGFFEIWLVVIFGVIGYGMKKYNYPTGPLILAVILAPLTEGYFRQALMMSQGSYAIFIQRPISLGFFLVIASIAVVTVIRQLILRNKNKVQKLSA